MHPCINLQDVPFPLKSSGLGRPHAERERCVSGFHHSDLVWMKTVKQCYQCNEWNSLGRGTVQSIERISLGKGIVRADLQGAQGKI